MVVETKQMVVVLAVTEVNEDVVVQWLGWKGFGCRKRKGTFFVFWYRTGWKELRKRRLTKSLDSDENFKPYLVKTR